MATAKKTPAKKATKPATKAKVAAPAKKPAKAPAKASDGPLYTMPQEVKDWIERAQSIMNHQKGDRKSTRLNSSHIPLSRMPSSA